jgi:hypothetical protein
MGRERARLMILWHYTCDHSHAKIQAQPALLLKPSPVTGMLWLTDLNPAPRKALGLTMKTISCDRMRHRYLVTDDEKVIPWMELRRAVHPRLTSQLEEADGVMPMHWYVAFEPVAARYIPEGRMI